MPIRNCQNRGKIEEYKSPNWDGHQSQGAILLTLNSKAPTAIPDAAPVPERPMKCSLPILLANSDAPT